jgi:hypothetical protein
MVRARRSRARSPALCSDQPLTMSRTPKIRNPMSQESGPPSVVSHVMDAEYLIVDQCLHDVGDVPAGGEDSEVEAPVWCQASQARSGDRGDGSGQDQKPKSPNERSRVPVC